MKWFGKESKNQKQGETDSVDEFKDFLNKSIREEKTQVVQNKRQDNRLKSMARLLLDNGYSVEEINTLCKSKKSFQVLKGDLKERE